MALLDEWNAAKAGFDRIKPPQGSNKVEKPIADFSAKIVKKAESTVKAMNAAIAKKDVKALSKHEAAYHKLVLDAAAAEKTMVAALKNLSGDNRASNVKMMTGSFVGRMQDLKGYVADARKSLQDSGPVVATELIPPKVFQSLRGTVVTRTPNVIEFGNNKGYATLLTSGANNPVAARHQKTFNDTYKKLQAVLKRVDQMKTAKGTRDQFGMAMDQLFDDYMGCLNAMSTAVTEWMMLQSHELGKAGENPASKPRYGVADDVAKVLADENKRIITLRDSVKKLFPRHMR